MNLKTFRLFILLYVIISLISVIPNFENVDEIERPSGDTIIIMTYNLRFGVGQDGYDLGEIQDTIAKGKPNIVAFQEVTLNSPFNGFAPMYNDLLSLMAELGFAYSYISEGFNYNLVNAVFSQYEIKSERTLDYETQNSGYQRNVVITDIDVNGKILKIYNTHLTHKPSGAKSGNERTEQVTELMLDILNQNLNTENLALIGDFNIVTTTEEYQIITSTLADAWELSNPNDPGFTVSVGDLNKRIDYIFINDQITLNSCELVSSEASDHLPVMCEIQIS